MKTIIAAVLAIGMTAMTVSSVAIAQTGPGQGAGYGRGNTMGGYGYGPGMMGGYGPGMMGGYGPGMMGGGAYGPGMMRGGAGFGGPLALLDLSEEQREKVARIQEENRAKNWTAMGQLRSEQFKLRQMYFSDKIDPNTYADQQRKVDELRRNMLKSRIEARNQIDALLTKEQRQQFRSFGPWWAQDEMD